MTVLSSQLAAMLNSADTVSLGVSENGFLAQYSCGSRLGLTAGLNVQMLKLSVGCCRKKEEEG